MRFTVNFDGGSWLFEVSSVEGEDDYHEVFEIVDIDEAKAAASDIFDELLELCDPIEAALRESFREDEY